MSRWWTEHVADLMDRLHVDINVDLPENTIAYLLLFLILAGLVVLIIRQAGKHGWSRRSKKAVSVSEAELTDAEVIDDETPPDEAAPDQLPDLTTAALANLADRYAAEGRYAEAVRERLRAIVRSLIDAGVIVHSPGWTVTELAGAASQALPPIGPAVAEASRIFSDIWYGLRPATAAHDNRMRELADFLAGQLRPLAVR